MIGQFFRTRFVVVVAIAVSLIVSYNAPHTGAQEGPAVTVQPSRAAPGETVSITGTGWPAGAQLTARLYARGSGPTGPQADLASPFRTDASGSFSFQATVPLTLLNPDGNRGNLYLVPGQYNLLVQSGPELSSSVVFTAAAPRQGSSLWGEIGFDKDRDGRFDVYEDTRAGSGVAVMLMPAGGGSPRQALTDAFGYYLFTPIPAGSYTLRAESQYQGASWAASGAVSTTDARVTKIDLALAPKTGGPPAVPNGAVTVGLKPVDGSGVSGLGTVVSTDRGGATVSLEVNGLEPAGDYRAQVNAGTCSTPSASFGLLGRFQADGAGKGTLAATEFGPGRKLEFSNLADGDHILSIVGQKVLACGAIPKVEVSSPEQPGPRFKLGFETLASYIPTIVGRPLEDEHHAASGDSLQQTTTGLMVWRKADNWTAFTDGWTTWINGPEGVQVRPNGERFDWEGGAKVGDLAQRSRPGGGQCL